MTSFQLQEQAALLRRETLRMIYEHKDGHPSPSLSIADIISVLYFDAMKIDPANPNWEERDRLVLSKGHACPVVYAALNERGYFSPKISDFQLRELGSIFQGHPVMNKTPGIDYTSGSLGNGIAVASGMALAGKLKNLPYYVFVICGDGELQEGVIWEGANIAAARKLDNVIAFIDKNGKQSGGKVEDIIGSNNVAERFTAFGWDVQELQDGNDIDSLRAAIKQAQSLKNGKPKAIVCNTVKGKGVDFIEADNSWHKRTPTEAEYQEAMRQLGGRA